MEGRIRELSELLARYGAYAEEHDKLFADVEVHKGCKERMGKILEKWQQELAQLKEQSGK